MTQIAEVKWACPRCGATPDGHAHLPEREQDKCIAARGMGCMGFVCECDDTGEDPDHGNTHSKPCPAATCHHCEWSGTFPKRPKNLLPWEKKALAAGWQPPKGWPAV